MQKKNYSEEHESSNWEKVLKKQQRSEMLKKIAIWGAIVIVCVAGLGTLVKFADKSTSNNSIPQEVANLPAPKSTDIIVGDENAKVIITEYADLQCPACASVNPLTNQVLDEYKGKVKLVYRFFPLRGIHKNALISGQAAYGAWRLGKFSEMKDLLYENQPSWENLNDPRETFIEYAKEIGLDSGKFQTLMNSDEAKNAVLEGEKEALGLGLNSTPTFFIGNRKFSPRGLEDFKQLIDEELKNSGSEEAKPTTQPLQ